MKTLFLFSLVVIFATGCAKEACYVDREFGKATSDAIDKQIINRNPLYAEAEAGPTGMPGIHSEKIMDNYNYSFTRESLDAPQVNFTRGVPTSTIK